MPFVDYPDFAADDAEAKSRFLLAKQDDPFTEIADALLNSADIFDYIRMTGMLYPFHRDKLKSGSYEAAIRGRCIWWDKNGDRQERFLVEENKDEFVLEANSIAFVQVEPFFRLPDYIALRFNLKIKHVHRGILLGTGPLIDPGFVGRLLIPIHNLTTNEYRFKCGEGLIWIEFTKTSSLPRASHQSQNSLGLIRRGKYVPFPDEKNNLEPEDYLSKASPHKPIRSSIPQALQESSDLAKQSAQSAMQAAERAEQARKTIQTFSVYAGIIFVLTLAGVTYTTWDLIQNTWKIANDLQQQLRQDIGRDQGLAREALEELRRKLQSFEQRLTDEVAAMQSRLDRLSKGPGLLNGRSGAAKQDDQKRGSKQEEAPVR